MIGAREVEDPGVLAKLVEKLKQILAMLKPQPEREIGVENRFYYDEHEKVWKLEGGETPEEEEERLRLAFHTGRGLQVGDSARAPPTTACDASRAGVVDAALPPPPTNVAITRASRTPSAGSNVNLAHPVYAPQSSFVPTANAPSPAESPPTASEGSAPLGAPQAAPASGQPNLGGPPVANNPFQAAQSMQPRTSPFGGAAVTA